MENVEEGESEETLELGGIRLLTDEEHTQITNVGRKVQEPQVMDKYNG